MNHPPMARPAMDMEFIPGEAHRRSDTSSCNVVSTPVMEEVTYHLRTTALMLTATGPWDDITTNMVARAVERDHGFPCRDIKVAPCFPEDFILMLAERHQRDLVFERRAVVVAGVSDPVGGPLRLSGNGFGRIRLPCAKVHPREAAFDITTSARAAKPPGRPTVYLSPRAQDKVKALFPFSFSSKLQK